MKTMIRHARIISPDLEIGEGAVVMEEGRVVSVAEGVGESEPGAREIDADGRMVMPGFFDLHAHGAGGDDVCDGEVEAVRRIARRKVMEGVTSWLPTTLTQAGEVLEAAAAACAGYRASADFCRVPGLHLEGPFIHRDFCGAQDVAHVRAVDVAEVERLSAIAPVRVVSLAPELPGAIDFIRRMSVAGVVCSAAHTAAGAREVREAIGAGMRHLTHFCNAMSPLHHREIGVVGAGLMEETLSLEVIADGVHLCGDMLRLIYRLVGVERLMMVTDSTAASWLGDGEISLGGRAVDVVGGVARIRETGGLAGSTLKFNEGLNLLHEVTGMPLHQLVKVTGFNQARSLGMEGFGRIAPGYHADLVILNTDFSVWKVFVAGRELICQGGSASYEGTLPRTGHHEG